jgi:hypothetical protein
MAIIILLGLWTDKARGYSTKKCENWDVDEIYEFNLPTPFFELP